MTTSERLRIATLEFASTTWTVKLLVPVAVVVPEITPVEEFKEMPEGNAPEASDQL